MIKARYTQPDGSPGLVFGLSHENIKRLKAGEPISFELSALGLPGKVLIFAGKDEEAMKEILKPFLPALRAEGVEQ